MKKRIWVLALIALCTLSLCACKNTKSDDTDSEKEEIKKWDRTEWESTEPVEIPQEEPEEETEKETEADREADDGTGLAKPIVSEVKVVAQDSEEAKDFAANYEQMDQWHTALKDMSVTFPSCKEFTDGLSIKTVTTSDELVNYVDSYSDVWSIKDDTLVVERTKFTYNHSWFYNLTLISGDDGIHYYIIENPEFEMEYSYTLDEDMVFFDESSKTLYLSVIKDFNYEEYLKMTSSNKAITKIKEEAKSNRMFVALNYPDEVEIKEVVFIMP